MFTIKYTPTHIANYFLWRAWKEDVSITPLQLLQLIYIAYGWHLVVAEEKLFDEKIEAWKYGVVVPSIYHEFKRFGYNSIKKGFYSEKEIESAEEPNMTFIENKDNTLSSLLHLEWEYYKDIDSIALSNIIHEDGGAWEKAYKKGQGSILDDELIKERAKIGIVKAIEYKAKRDNIKLDL